MAILSSSESDEKRSSDMAALSMRRETADTDVGNILQVECEFVWCWMKYNSCMAWNLIRAPSEWPAISPDYPSTLSSSAVLERVPPSYPLRFIQREGHPPRVAHTHHNHQAPLQQSRPESCNYRRTRRFRTPSCYRRVQ
jgi:hypothetical protein